MRIWCVRRTELALGLLLVPAGLAAQGVSGAALQGVLTGRNGQPIVDAVIEVSNLGNGARWQATTRSSGRYYLDNLVVGGPYQVEARAVGYRSNRQSGIYLSLGQRLTLDLLLDAAVFQLDTVTIRGIPDARINAGRTGPSQSVSESTLTRLPVAGRNFSLLALLSPQVTLSPSGGLSITGQPDRLNGLQIDGSTNNDLLGGSALGGVGTPGQDLGARSLSLEAIQELQILTAPFDVRFGNFAAGLVNAVTRSGTNRWEGSLFGFYSGGHLIGPTLDGDRDGEFLIEEMGLTLGGPVVRNRAAFFLNAGLQRGSLPDISPKIGTDTTGGADSAETGIRLASVRRFQDILRNQYAVNPGSATGEFPLEVPARNFFGKLSVQLGVNSRLELSHDYAHTAPDILGCRGAPDGPYCLTSSGFSVPFTLNTTHLEWSHSSGTGLTNQLVLTRLKSHRVCLPNSDFVQLLVNADRGQLMAGETFGCGGDRTTQHLLELTDNLSFTAGAHRITLGTHDERIRIPSFNGVEYFFNAQWEFQSLDSLEQGLPIRYSATLRSPQRPRGPLSNLAVNLLGLYAQDQWIPLRGLTVTAGLRVDVPYIGTEPVKNPALETILGIDNTRTPSGNPLWAPRLGFSYDLRGNGSSFLRGGIGLFAGRPPLKWFDDVYSHTGLEAIQLYCTDSEVPTFVIDTANQPTSCAVGGPLPTAAQVNVFDPHFRFPRNLKVALGWDRRLGWDVVGTVDLTYTRAIDQYDLLDLNLQPPIAAPGEGGRLMYGAIDSFGFATPARLDPAFGPVMLIRNSASNHAFTGTVQLQKSLGAGATVQLSYTRTQSKDRFSPVSDNTVDDLNGPALDGSLDHRELRTSVFDVPHRVTLLLAGNLPFGIRAALFYEGSSGTPFTYQVAGDANGDGMEDDIVYVPRDLRPGGDISLADFDENSGTNVPAAPATYDRMARRIAREPCLRAARGRIMARNSCRTPWTTLASARVSTMLHLGGHSAEVTLDVFNLLHLFDRDWGLVRGNDDRLLGLVGYDTVRGRGLYQLLDPRRFIDLGASRWRMQLGMHYNFSTPAP
jgi:hypothetical protein